MWSGALSFGLVNIPVRLYSAAGEGDLKFRFLRQKDLSPIRYVKVARKDGKEVPFDEIVRGYEYKKGDFIVLTDDDFKKANVKRTKTIDITQFTDETEIDLIYAERPYYLEPDKGAAKPYALLREALRKSKKVGVAEFVLRNKEHLGVLKPMGNVIVLEQLRYNDEIRKPVGLDVPGAKKSDKKEVDMALALIDQLTKHFEPKDFKDEYKKEVTKIIAAKAKGKKIVPKGTEPEVTHVGDLMATLRKSLESGSGKKKTRAKTKA
jgi:DNA end-binding protein Ku